MITKSGPGPDDPPFEEPVESPAREDKFQRPAASRRSITSGFSIVSPVMRTARVSVATLVARLVHSVDSRRSPR